MLKYDYIVIDFWYLPLFPAEIEDDLMARSILTGKGKRASDSEGENSSTEEEKMRPLVTSSGECKELGYLARNDNIS